MPQKRPAGKKDIEIHYVVKKKFYPVIKANPYISKFHIVEKSIRDIIPVLKKENFDYVIDLHNNLRSILLKKLLGKPSFTIRKLNIKKWVLVNLKMNLLPEIHIVDRYIAAAKTLGIENDGLGLDHFIPPEDEVDITTLPEIYQKGYIAFVIGGNYCTKKLPVEKIISICRKISKPILLIGGKEDAENGATIASQASLCLNTCGNFNINQSASLIRQAGKVISHDTGLMHIAAAFKKEIISIWGNTIPEFGMYPYYGKFQIPNYKSEVQFLSCRPCSKLGFKKCPKNHFKCMTLQNENEIAGIASESIKKE